MSDEYIPTLTLDPNAGADASAAAIPAVEEPAPEEAKDIPVEKIELSKFSDQEQAAIRQFAGTIDITNSEQVMNYGAAAQKNISDFSGAALNSVRTKDLGEMGDMLSDLVIQLKSMDFDGKEEKKGLFILVKTSNPSSGEFQDQLIDGRPLYELVGEKVAKWGEEHMGDEYSYIGAVVGATYPKQGEILRKVMPKSFILVPGYGAQGGQGKDLVHFFNEDGLGAIINSSRGIIAAYKQEKYAAFGGEGYADASRQAVEDMIADIRGALENR